MNLHYAALIMLIAQASNKCDGVTLNNDGWTNFPDFIKAFDWMASSGLFYNLLNGSINASNYAAQFYYIEIPLCIFIVITIIVFAILSCIICKNRICCCKLKKVSHHPIKTTAITWIYLTFIAISIASALIAFCLPPSYYQGMKQTNCVLSYFGETLQYGSFAECEVKWKGLYNLSYYMENFSMGLNNSQSIIRQIATSFPSNSQKYLMLLNLMNSNFYQKYKDSMVPSSTDSLLNEAPASVINFGPISIKTSTTGIIDSTISQLSTMVSSLNKVDNVLLSLNTSYSSVSTNFSMGYRYLKDLADQFDLFYKRLEKVSFGYGDPLFRGIGTTYIIYFIIVLCTLGATGVFTFIFYKKQDATNIYNSYIHTLWGCPCLNILISLVVLAIFIPMSITLKNSCEVMFKQLFSPNGLVSNPTIINPVLGSILDVCFNKNGDLSTALNVSSFTQTLSSLLNSWDNITVEAQILLNQDVSFLTTYSYSLRKGINNPATETQDGGQGLSTLQTWTDSTINGSNVVDCTALVEKFVYSISQCGNYTYTKIKTNYNTNRKCFLMSEWSYSDITNRYSSANEMGCPSINLTTIIYSIGQYFKSSQLYYTDVVSLYKSISSDFQAITTTLSLFKQNVSSSISMLQVLKYNMFLYSDPMTISQFNAYMNCEFVDGQFSYLKNGMCGYMYPNITVSTLMMFINMLSSVALAVMGVIIERYNVFIKLNKN